MLIYTAGVFSQQLGIVKTMMRELHIPVEVQRDLVMLATHTREHSTDPLRFVVVPPKHLPASRPITSCFEFVRWLDRYGLVEMELNDRLYRIHPEVI